MLKPRKYQQEAIDKFKAENAACLFMEPGLGKTLTAINLYREYCKLEGGAIRCLIFAPVIVVPNWLREFLQCSKVPKNKICIIDGGATTKKVKLLEQDNVIVVINYDALSSEKVLKAMKDFNPGVIICDESQRIKSRASKRFKALYKLAKFVKYKMILTGTPAPNDEMDYFSQYLFVDNGKTFGTTITAYRNEYFINQTSSAPFPTWVFNENKRALFESKIAETAYMAKAEGNIELPDYQEIEIDVKLAPDQKKHYNQLKKDLVTWIDENKDNPLIVQNALVKMLRLNQISCGYLTLEDGKVVKLSNPKLDACLDLIDSFGGKKVLIFCIYKPNYDDLKTAFEKKGITYTEIHGGVKDKAAAVEALKDVQVAICHPRTAGLGVDKLKIAPYSIIYSRDASYENYEQPKKRNFRSGSAELHDKVIHYHLICPGVDRNLYTRVKTKDKKALNLLDIKNLL